MPLVFSPLSEAVLDQPPRRLLPRHAFIMRQLGAPTAIDLEINNHVRVALQMRGYFPIDASSTTGSKDYLERILGLIRSTGFTIAIFSDETRSSAMANICLELGFAAMSGKPLIICKSKSSSAPSDLKRTDWIDYDIDAPSEFDDKLLGAIDEALALAEFERNLMQVALDARSTDCAVALERCNKGFLLTGYEDFITAAESLLEKVNGVLGDDHVSDLERLRSEIRTFIKQARDSQA